MHLSSECSSSLHTSVPLCTAKLEHRALKLSLSHTHTHTPHYKPPLATRTARLHIYIRLHRSLFMISVSLTFSPLLQHTLRVYTHIQTYTPLIIHHQYECYFLAPEWIGSFHRTLGAGYGVAKMHRMP